MGNELKTTKGKFVKGDNFLVKQKITTPCEHKIDGAVKVAEYIVREIKKNTRSKIAEGIRYYASEEEYTKRFNEWKNSSLLQRLLTQPDPPNLLKAKALWTERVFKGRPWDHKEYIIETFKGYAVVRSAYSHKLKQNRTFKKHWHKYKNYDYRYDIWSNIHYGYVGLSVGFQKETLLNGANLAQIIDSSGGDAGDPIDDVTAINIGFSLYKKFGKFADKLTANDVLDELNKLPDNKLPDARKRHTCLESKNKL